MAKAVIETSDRWGEEFIGKLVMDNSIPPKARLEQMMKNLDELHWRPQQLSPSNAFVIGGASEQFSKHVQWHYHTCVWMMTELMVACGIPQEIAKRRAWEQRILWEGGLVCSRVLGDMSLFRGLMQRMPAYLLSPPDTPGFLPETMALPTFVRTEPSAP
jgi:TetR/AcrR family transcriptional regulator, lmrAB and yxaGH operons repressor